MRAKPILFAPLSLSLSVSACVAPPASLPPPVERAPAPAPPPRPVPLAADWRDWARTPGDWRYNATPTDTVATYGAATGKPALSMTCNRAARQVTLTTAGTTATAMTIRTTSVTRALPGRVIANTGVWAPIVLQATLPATDPLLDAMAFSRGRFVVEQAGSPPVVLPAWAEVGRVIQDCRP